ncbi:MAG: hypothetical protein V3T55_10425 [Anaerolineales bacterium]
MHLAGVTVTASRGGGKRGNNSNRRTAVKIYFVARTVGSKPARVTQDVIERKHWVTLKKKLAADGFVVTYWISVSDTVWDDVAADHKETQDVQEDRSREQRRRSMD